MTEKPALTTREQPAPLAQDVHQLPGHLIRQAQQAHRRMWVSEVSAEITSPQFGILNALLANPGIDQRTAGAEVGIDKSTLGDMIDRLFERKLVVTRRDPADQRRNLLFLSKAGQEVVAELAPRVLEMNRRFVSALDEDEQRMLIRLLHTVVSSAPGAAG